MENFDEFLLSISPKLKRLLAKYEIPLDDAPDVLQEAVLAFVAQVGEIREPATWLVGTLRHKCLLYWRSRRRRLYETMDVPVLEALSESYAPPQVQAELRADLGRALRQLPEKSRKLLTLRYLRGLEPEEVAAKLGYRPSSINKLTRRSLEVLRRKMDLGPLPPPNSGP